MNAARFRFSQHFPSTLKTLALFSALTLAACETQVTSNSNDLVESNRSDLLFAVDASTLGDANRAKVEQSIQDIVAGLQANGRDVRYAVYSAGTAGVDPANVPVGGGAPAGFDIFSNLFGIFGGSQFLMPGWSGGLPTGGGLPTQVTQGYPQLFPIISQIAGMSQSGSSQGAMLGSLLPIFSQVLGQQMGGSLGSNASQQMLLQLIQSGISGNQNGLNQNEIIASLAPQLLGMLQGGGLGGGQGNMASVLLPSLLRMFGQTQSGGGIDQSQITSMLLPILMSQMGGGGFGGQQPLQLLGSIFPLMQQFTGVDQNQIQNLAVALAPLAATYFSGGAGASYAPMIQALIPVLFQAMGNGSQGLNVTDSAQLLGTPGITSLLSAFAGGGPLADGFLRNGADFSVIYLGDQMHIGDQTQAATMAHTFLMNLSQLTKNDLANFSFNSIAMNSTSQCVGNAGGSADALAAILSQRTSGAVTDLCGLQEIIALLSR